MALPFACPRCGESPGGGAIHISQTKSHRHARRLQVWAGLVAPVSFVVMLIAFNAGVIHFSFAFGWAFIGGMFTPSLLLYAISLFLPHVRTVTCYECGWSDEAWMRRW